MDEKKVVIIVGKDKAVNLISEKMFRLGGFNTITVRSKRKAKRLLKTEKNAERIFISKKT